MQQSNTYTFFFAIVVCVVCSLCLAFAYSALKPLQVKNIELDKQKNILMAAGVQSKTLSADQVTQLFKDEFDSFVINQNGDILTGTAVNQIPKGAADQFAVYRRKSAKDGDVYVIPISGKGLWSTIYGYFALEQDLNTVKGITFYQHAETPGLGAEIENENFIKNYIGKKILDGQGQLVSVTIVKGLAKDQPASKHEHIVDGISGATLTTDGVNNFIKATLAKYEPFFKQQRK